MSNDYKHARSLSRAIQRDLLARKKNLSNPAFKQLQQEHARYRANKDTQAMLKLHQKIADMV